MIDVASSQLIIVDMQERLVPATVDGDSVTANVEIVLDTAAILGVPYTISEQYPKGLGATVAPVLAKADRDRVFDKVHFSCVDDDRLEASLRALDRRQTIVCGMEAHVCVLQSVLGLMESGYDVHVIADAVTSRTERNRDLALDRMREEGAAIVSTEMVVFEWLRTAGHPDFRVVSNLIK